MASEFPGNLIAVGHATALGGGAYEALISGPVNITRQVAGGFTLRMNDDEQRLPVRTSLVVTPNGTGAGLIVDIGPSAQPLPALYAMNFLAADGTTLTDPASFTFALYAIPPGIEPVTF